MASNNYTLGRGTVHFARFKTGTQTPDGFRYMGNTPEFSLTIESEELEHYSSDGGIREKDDSVPLEVNRTGSLITDNISPDNVALFFFGETLTVTQAPVASSEEIILDINLGYSYLLGQSDSNPTGFRGIDPTGFAVAVDPAGTPVPLVVDVDYTMDFDNGVLSLLDTSIIAVDGVDIGITYAVLGSSRSRVISGSTPVEGALMYISENPKGDDQVFYMPYIKVTPNGDYALKGDEWQQIPMSIEVLKRTSLEAIYRDNDPVYS